jgi:hypothetical protein
MNCNGDFSHLRWKTEKPFKLTPERRAGAACQIAARDNRCPEAREPFHFGEQQVIRGWEAVGETKKEDALACPRRACELSPASEEPTGYLCAPEFSQATGLILARPLD